jgi:uncharacterized protein (TIGR02145 family)
MRKITLTILCALLAIVASGQAPQGFTHQAVIRDANNQLIIESSIGIKVSIIQGSTAGDIVYSETHLPVSNTNGLISFIIGHGTVVSGVFAEIDWASGPYFIETKADPTGGTNYTIEGTSQMLSVPYALHSKTVENVFNNLLPPSVIVLDATELQPFSATLNGLVNGKGFSTTVTFEWGPTTEYGNTITALQSPVTGSDEVSVSAILTGLQPFTNYHYRINAINAVDVTLSEDVIFTTETGLPQLTTEPVTNILAFSAISGGNVTYDGGADVTARGVVWSTAENPTIEANEGITTDGIGMGVFTSNLISLTPETTYFVRAYATNLNGTAYGDELSFSTASALFACGISTINDIDGNIYNTVLIGTQCWMKENLKTTKYRNGDPIPNVIIEDEWYNLTSGAFAWYDHNFLWKDIYGALYNGHATVDIRGLCPFGWRMPDSSNWDELVVYIGGPDAPNGNNLKSCRQYQSPLGGECATNEHPVWGWHETHYGIDFYGFSGLPGGFRYADWGTASFFAMTLSGFWWEVFQGSQARVRGLSYNDGGFSTSVYNMQFGMSVRCVRE